MTINRNNYEEYLIDYMDGSLSSELCGELELFLEANPDIKKEMDGLGDVFLSSDENSFESKDILRKELVDCDDDTVDELFAKKLEGDLTKEENLLLDELLVQNPEKLESWKLISKTKLTPEKIEFNNKASLHANAPIDYSIPENLIIGNLEGDLNTKESEAFSSLVGKNKILKNEVNLFEKTKLSAPIEIVFEDKEKLKKGAVVAMWPRYAAAIAAAVLVLVTFRFYFNSDSARLATNFKHNSELRSVQLDESAPIIDQEEILENHTENKNLNYSFANVTSNVGSEQKSESKERVKSPILTKLNSVNSENIASLDVEKIIVLPEHKDIVIVEEELMASNNTMRSNEFPTVIGMLEGKVKEQLWGNNEYPEDNYLLALSGKAVEKLTENSNTDVEMDVTEVKKGGLFLKIGRFSVERK